MLLLPSRSANCAVLHGPISKARMPRLRGVCLWWPGQQGWHQGPHQIRQGLPLCAMLSRPRPQGRTHRHEPLVLVQTLPVGRNEQAPVLDPARVQPRLLLQVPAHHAPRVGQKLHLHVAGPQLPQQAWQGQEGGGREGPSAPSPAALPPLPPAGQGSQRVGRGPGVSLQAMESAKGR